MGGEADTVKDRVCKVCFDSVEGTGEDILAHINRHKGDFEDCALMLSEKKEFTLEGFRVRVAAIDPRNCYVALAVVGKVLS